MVMNLNLKKYLTKLFIRSFIAIFLFIVGYFILSNDTLYYRVHNIIFDSTIDFSYIKSKTNILMGNIFGKTTNFVSSEKLAYKSIDKYLNGSRLLTGEHYVVNNLYGGVVIYIGNKEYLGNTVIILGDDGVNYWYSNLENISVNLYDFVSSGTIIGSTKDQYLYVTLQKDDEYLDYEEYIQS